MDLKRMNKITFEKAKAILDEIDRAKSTIEKISKTDSIYYKTPDMDGGYTEGKFVAFYTRDEEDLKQALTEFFNGKISKLEQEFEAL